MTELVEYIVRRLVDEPDSVVVTEVERGHALTYQIEVAEGDLGQVIGRGGRIANALRTIVGALQDSDGVRRTVDIMS